MQQNATVGACRMRRVLAVLGSLFFLSGAAALAYQVAWLRLLSLIFGVTVHAASAVLTSFMAGLALGSWLGGRLADRVAVPLRWFAIAELGIAASTLAVPFALQFASAVYPEVYRRFPDALIQLTIARIIFSGFVLVVPTTLMGASLPLLARHATRRGPAVAARIGWLYAANTAGGVLGSIGAGFILIGAAGVTFTTRVAASLNLAVGLCALAIGARQPRLQSQAGVHQTQASAIASPAQRVILFVTLIAGFGGLALEVVWFRVLTLFLTTTTYAFTTMLSTVLLGLALGSAMASLPVRRSKDRQRTTAWLLVWTGIFVLVSMTALAHTYRIGWRTSGMIQACVLAMLPATMLMGATFPYILAIWLGNVTAAIGKPLGVLYAVNVLGAVAGSLAGGFLLIPWLGTRGSLIALAGMYVCAGCMVFATMRDVRRKVPQMLVACAIFVLAAMLIPDLYASILVRRYEAGERLLYRSEGVQTTVAVHDRPPGVRVLYLDGLHQANDSAETVQLHSQIGLLPMALHPDPQRALVIGVGGGVTAGAVALYPRTTVDIVELSPTVLSVLPYFAHVNRRLRHRPNVNMRVDDGRNFLQLTSRRYDVITADIIQPIHAGAGNVYSVEYFALARRALSDGGLMLQWVGRRDDLHYRLIMKTFLQVFPHATLWSGGELMVGGTGRLAISRAAFERHRADANVRLALDRVGLDSFEALLARYTAGPAEMRQFVGDGAVITDDWPILEYHRSLPSSGIVDVAALKGDVTRHVKDR